MDLRARSSLRAKSFAFLESFRTSEPSILIIYDVPHVLLLNSALAAILSNPASLPHFLWVFLPFENCYLYYLSRRASTVLYYHCDISVLSITHIYMYIASRTKKSIRLSDLIAHHVSSLGKFRNRIADGVLWIRRSQVGEIRRDGRMGLKQGTARICPKKKDGYNTSSG